MVYSIMKSVTIHAFISIGLLPVSLGFLMNKVDPGMVAVAPGQKLSLLCATDGHWEYCKFYSPSGQSCDLEWKRAFNDVRKQECDLGDRVEFYGQYNDMECGIQIQNTLPEDTGVWTCHMEEYVFLGGRGSGRMVEARINVTVQASTTPPPQPSTTPLTTTTTSTSSTTTTTSTKSGGVVENFDAEGTHFDSEGILEKIDSTEDRPAGAPEAVPRIEEDDSATSIIIGVICAVLLVGALALAAFVIRRRRRGPDATAAVVYDREARAVHDERTMVPGHRTTEVRSRESTLNYHEFFPPRISSNGTPESQD